MHRELIMNVKMGRKRWWMAALLLAFAALAVLSFIARSRGRTQWAIAFDTADAGFYRIGWEEPSTNGSFRFVSNAYVLGPIKIFSRTEERVQRSP